MKRRQTENMKMLVAAEICSTITFVSFQMICSAIKTDYTKHKSCHVSTHRHPALSSLLLELEERLPAVARAQEEEH